VKISKKQSRGQILLFDYGVPMCYATILLQQAQGTAYKYIL